MVHSFVDSLVDPFLDSLDALSAILIDGFIDWRMTDILIDTGFGESSRFDMIRQELTGFATIGQDLARFDKI